MTPYAKGRREEEKLVRILRSLGIEAERVPLSGSTRRDKADILVDGVAISVKYGKACPKSLYLASMGWLGEVLVVPLLPWLYGCINRTERLPKISPRNVLAKEVQPRRVLAGRDKRGEWKLAGRLEDLLVLKEKGCYKKIKS